MREISTKKIEIGEHVLVDRVEYVAEKADRDETCEECALYSPSHVCSGFINCDNIIFKRVKKLKCRPYKDTEEMIADYKERFDICNVPPFSKPSIWVKNGKISSSITDIMPEKVVVYCDEYDMKDLFRSYTYLDGSPCGKVGG